MRTFMKKITCGEIRGLNMDNGISVFRGIKYANAGRWEYPEMVTSWRGVYDATEFGKASFQMRAFKPEVQNGEKSFYYREFREDEIYEYSEDCQYLNIWAPKDAENVPVVLYIHGGAFMGGCGNEKHFDGTQYAKRGIIFITCNYRLAVLGYCALPELEAESGHTGNYGLYDQLTALRWVHKFIHDFGGNPDNITLMGQSAGAMSIQQLCVSPLAKPMIHQVIMTSGGGIGKEFAKVKSIKEAVPFWKKVMEKLGTELEEWKTVGVEALFQAFIEEVFKEQDAISNCMPLIDGRILPDATETLAMEGQQADVPYLMGTTSEDMLPDTLQDMAMEWALLQHEQGKKDSYYFYFKRQLPGDTEGAWHSSELWYTIGALQNCWRPMTDWDYHLSDIMISYIENFVRTGNPNGSTMPEWLPMTASQKKAMIFGDETIEMGSPGKKSEK